MHFIFCDFGTGFLNVICMKFRLCYGKTFFPSFFIFDILFKIYEMINVDIAYYVWIAVPYYSCPNYRTGLSVKGKNG